MLNLRTPNNDTRDLFAYCPVSGQVFVSLAYIADLWDMTEHEARQRLFLADIPGVECLVELDSSFYYETTRYNLATVVSFNHPSPTKTEDSSTRFEQFVNAANQVDLIEHPTLKEMALDHVCKHFQDFALPAELPGPLQDTDARTLPISERTRRELTALIPDLRRVWHFGPEIRNLVILLDENRTVDQLAVEAAHARLVDAQRNWEDYRQQTAIDKQHLDLLSLSIGGYVN